MNLTQSFMLHALFQFRYQKDKETKEFPVMSFFSHLHFTLYNLLQAKIVFLKHLLI